MGYKNSQMVVSYDYWFRRDEEWKKIELIESIEINGEIVFDKRKSYPDGSRGSSYGGELIYEVVQKSEIKNKIIEKFLKNKGGN